MISRVRQGGWFSMMALVLGLGLWISLGSSAWAQHGGGHGGGGHMGGMGGHMGGMGGAHHMGGMGGVHHMGGFGGRGFGFGNRGFGGFGFFPGFFGFGYPYYGGYGLGYGGFGYPYYGGYGLGYGGYGLGLGYGGYGLGYGLGYGGYGYPYYGGYGYGYGYPYYGYGSGYGYGYPNYANIYTTPGVGVTYSSAYVAPAGSAANTVMLPQGRYLGIDEEPITDASGQHGMKITNVYPGTAAERAGLRAGDVIYSINGYLTEQRGNLAWIIANAASNNQLRMNVKTAKDNQEHTITAQLR